MRNGLALSPIPPPPQAKVAPLADGFLARVAQRQAQAAVVGLGHVGLPLARTIAAAGLPTLGFDLAAARIAGIAAGRSPLDHLPDAALQPLVAAGRLRATTDPALLAEADAVLICVPTPLGPGRQPDLGCVTDAADAVARALRPGQLVVLESTTWPGTTRRIVAPILERTGLVIGRDIFLAYSPEREDPGNGRFATATTPKLVAGADPLSLRLAVAFYGAFIRQVVPVDDMETAEAAKLAENVFRAVNIALANELKLCFGALGLDPWRVIEAAATKPFGYMPFWPGPGPGGHCIPVDPHYLAAVTRARGVPARLIETAMAVNEAAPSHVLARLEAALLPRRPAGLPGSRVLVLGVGYKRNIADPRGSAGVALLDRLAAAGAEAAYHDPHVPALPGRAGLSWPAVLAGRWDAVLIATDHDAVDYAALVARAPLVVDTRNVCARLGLRGAQIVAA